MFAKDFTVGSGGEVLRLYWCDFLVYPLRGFLMAWVNCTGRLRWRMFNLHYFHAYCTKSNMMYEIVDYCNDRFTTQSLPTRYYGTISSIEPGGILSILLQKQFWRRKGDGRSKWCPGYSHLPTKAQLLEKSQLCYRKWELVDLWRDTKQLLCLLDRLVLGRQNSQNTSW